MNVDLINRMIEAMKADDGNAILMNNFMMDVDRFRSTGCGTAGCMAGWAYMVHYERATKRDRDFALAENWETGGARLLGLGDTLAYNLFYMLGCLWGETGDFDGLEAPTRKLAAIAVLKHLRDTGEVDWDKAIEIAWAERKVTTREE